MSPLPIGQPRLADALRRYLGARGAMTLEVVDDLLPVVLVNDAAAPELRLLRDERCWMGSNTAAAVAAQFSFVRLENNNPAILVIAEKIFIGPVGVNARVQIATVKSVGVGSTVGSDQRPLDGRRYSASLISGADIRSGTRAAAANLGVPELGTSGVSLPAMREFWAVLPPGWSLEMEVQTANAVFTAGFTYRVRTLEAEES